jgi:hypothetical protein
MTRTLSLTLAGLALVAVLSACDDAGAPSVTLWTNTLTPGIDAPFVLTQPVVVEAALTEDNMLGAATFVLDVESGLAQVLKPDLGEARIAAQGGQGGVFVSWYDDDTLLARNIDGRQFLVDLDGTITEQDPPIATATPGSPTGGGASSDGAWQASITATVGPGAVVSRAGGASPMFLIPSVSLPLWSPTDPRALAMVTDVCVAPANSGFDFAIFDADTAELREISARDDEIVITYEWRPDGGAVAAEVVSTRDQQNEPRAELRLIDVRDGSSRALAAINAGGSLVPTEWSPDGRRLLFGYNGGRGLCDDPFVPAAPSVVERIE